MSDPVTAADQPKNRSLSAIGGVQPRPLPETRSGWTYVSDSDVEALMSSAPSLLPVELNQNQFVSQPAPIPEHSGVVGALLYAIWGLLVVLAGCIFLVSAANIAKGWQPEQSSLINLVVATISFAIVACSAWWIGRQAGSGFGWATLLLFVIAVPKYIFLQKRGAKSAIQNCWEIFPSGKIFGSFAAFGLVILITMYVAPRSLATQPGAGEDVISAVLTPTIEVTQPVAKVASKAKPTETAKPAATKTPKIAKTLSRTDYPPLVDIREIVARTGKAIGQKISFTGQVAAIFDTGQKQTAGDAHPKDYEATLQIVVTAPDGSVDAVIVGYNGTTKGIFKDSYVTVYGKVVDSTSFVGSLGGQVTQPLIAAQFVDQSEDSAPIASSQMPQTQTTHGNPPPASVASTYSDADVRELEARTGDMIGQKIMITGEVVAIFDTGHKVELGDSNPKSYSAQIQIFVSTADGGVEGVWMGYDADTSGIFKGSLLTVYGVVVDTESFIGAEGGAITQPLLQADFIVVGSDSP